MKFKTFIFILLLLCVVFAFSFCVVVMFFPDKAQNLIEFISGLFGNGGYLN